MNDMPWRGDKQLVTVLNVDGQELTPCLPHRAWREVNRLRAVWVNASTIQLLYDPFAFRDYRKVALLRDHNTCLWCGELATTADHIVPSSRGGFDLPGNLLASCGECNSKRGNRPALFYLIERMSAVPDPVQLYIRIIEASLIHPTNLLW